MVRKPPAKVNTVDPEESKKSEQTDDYKDQNSSAGKGFKSAIDYRSSQVNINQILVDFRSTITAIGAPDDIKEEVSGYLKLVDLQAQKPKPSKKIIDTNLKNAAEILDGYISKALNRNSKVVTDWIDALLLQNVDYKAPVKEIQSVSLTKAEEPVTNNPIVQAETSQIAANDEIKTNETKQPVNLEKVKLKKFYRHCEKLIDSENYDQALTDLGKALKYAQKIDDKDTTAQIYMDMGFVYDVNNNLPQALEYYNNAANTAKLAENKPLQAKAHYDMATIYDDVGKIDSALEHYYAALGLDGETENLQGQSLTLNNIGNMLSLKEDYKTSLGYYKIAFGLAKEQSDKIGQAAILGNVAGVFRNLGIDTKALGYYKESAKLDNEAGNIPGYAKTLDIAGDIMLDNGKKIKAETLYKKSLVASQQIGDRSWSAKMMQKISSLN